MPFPSIVDPVPGTPITAAWEIANPLAAARWLRQLMGNADPPGSNYVVVSSSVSSGAWAKIPVDALAAGVCLAQIGPGGITNAYLATDSVDDRVLATGAAMANLTYRPVNSGGDFALTGPVGWNSSVYVTGATNQLFLVSGQFVHFVAGGTGTIAGTFDVVNKTISWGGAAAFTGNLNAAAAVLTGLLTANSGVNVTGAVSINGATTSTQAITATRFVSTVASGTPPFSVSSPTMVTLLNAELLGGANRAYYEGLAASGVPSGLIAAFETAASIPGGWGRYTAADGRMLVGAGSVFSVTWTEATSYGSSWSHTHADAGHSHGSGSLSVTGTTTAESNSGQSAGTGTNRADAPHTHGFTASVGGTTNNGTAVISSDAWMIPSRAIVWARKS